MTVIDNINLLDLDIFEKGEVHEALKVLRHEAPVYWNEGNDELKGFWNLTRYEDVRYVSSHPELFSSAKGISGPGLRDPEHNPNAVSQPGGISIITMDPPRHVKMRRLVNKGFTPRAVNAMEPRIREIATAILDRLGDRTECDFVLDVASQLPLAVICGLMGIPEEHWPLMFQLTNQTLGAADPEYQAESCPRASAAPSRRRRDRARGPLKMMDFFRSLLEERRKTPGDDLVSVLLESEIDGERLDEVDILAFCFLLVLAGNETTRNAISGGLLGAVRAPGRARAAAGGHVAAGLRGRGDPALDLAGAPHGPPSRRRTSRSAARRCEPGESGADVVSVGQPRRGRLRRAVPLRHHPLRRTSTWRSASASTSAWAPASPDKRCA